MKKKEIDGIIENNQTEDNTSTENTVTETETNTSKEPEIIGKEEEESSKENTGLTDQETAIKIILSPRRAPITGRMIKSSAI